MPPLIKLESIAGDEKVEILHADSGEITIGREPENAVVVDSESVSRRHCALYGVGNYWVFRDFGSTNGTWVNGVQVASGAVKLIRSGDKLQIADFPILVTEIGPDTSVAHVPTQALLFFSGESFEGQFDFVPNQMRCIVGGPQAHFQTKGENHSLAEIYVHRSSGRIEVSVARSRTVMLNNSVVGGAATVSDRDELVIGPYSVVVVDSGSDLGSSAQHFKPGFDPNSREVRSLHAFAGGAYAGGGGQGGGTRGWESEARPKEGGRRLILGAGNIDPSGTQVVSSMKFRHSGFETNPSQRFALAAAAAGEDDDSSKTDPRQMIITGVIVLLVILGAIAFVLFS